MIYLVDGVAVNARTDWKHRLNPLEPGRVEQRFPGLAQAFVTKEPALPPQLYVEGFLEGTGTTPAAACDALIANLRTWITKSGQATLRTVTLHGTAFPECELVDVPTLGSVESVSVDNPNPSADPPVLPCKVRQRVRFVWRPLWAAASTVPGDGGGA